MKAVLREVLQEVLEGEMTEPLGLAPRQRTESRQGEQAGDSSRGLARRMGKRKLEGTAGPHDALARPRAVVASPWGHNLARLGHDVPGGGRGDAWRLSQNFQKRAPRKMCH